MKARGFLACNYWQSGIHQGHFQSIRFEFGNWHLSLDCLYGDRAMKCADDGKTLSVGKLTVPTTSVRRWYGNWCWDAFEMSLEDALKVWNHVHRTKRFRPGYGAAVLWNLWRKKEPLTGEGLKRAIAREKRREAVR